MFQRLILQFVVVALIALIAFCFSACAQDEETPPLEKHDFLRALEELRAEGQGEGENGWPRLVEAAERYEAIAHEWLFERNDAPEEWITGIDYNRIWKNRLTDEERMRYRELIEQVKGAGVFDIMHDALQSPRILVLFLTIYQKWSWIRPPLRFGNSRRSAAFQR